MRHSPLNAALVANEENAAKAKCLRLSFPQSCALIFKVLGVNKSRFVLLLVCCFRSRLVC